MQRLKILAMASAKGSAKEAGEASHDSRSEAVAKGITFQSWCQIGSKLAPGGYELSPLKQPKSLRRK